MFKAWRRKRREAEIFRLIDVGFEALGTGDLEAATRAADGILQIDPAQVDALFLHGQVAHRQERLDVAEDYYERAILAKPDFVDPYKLLMDVLITSYRHHEALAVCKLALSRIKPSLESQVDLCAAISGEFPEEARELLAPALDRNNTMTRVWTVYQAVLHRLRVEGEEYEAFLAGMRDLFPGTMELEAVEASALAYRGRMAEALEAYAALSIKYPALPVFGHERARLARGEGYVDLAEDLAQQLIKEYPQHADFPFLLSEIKLSKGEIALGLALNEKRFARTRGFNWKYLPMPLWQGEPLAGKRILVIEEQGFGDCIMFGRYLPMLLARGARIRYVCRPQIYSMFAAQPGLRHAEIIMHSADLKLPDDMDYYISNMSVAGRLGIDRANAGEGSIYLTPDPERVAEWRERLKRDGRPLVGITWAANLTTSFGFEKSIPQQLVPRILDNPDIAFVSLQVPANLDDPHRHLFAHTPPIADFSDTIALLACLDAVISVDTSVAHLAASIGKRTFLLSKFAPDWRWDGPLDGKPYWYPEVEVLRQHTPRDWSVAVERLRERLRTVR